MFALGVLGDRLVQDGLRGGFSAGTEEAAAGLLGRRRGRFLDGLGGGFTAATKERHCGCV